MAGKEEHPRKGKGGRDEEVSISVSIKEGIETACRWLQWRPEGQRQKTVCGV